MTDNTQGTTEKKRKLLFFSALAADIKNVSFNHESGKINVKGIRELRNTSRSFHSAALDTENMAIAIKDSNKNGVGIYALGREHDSPELYCLKAGSYNFIDNSIKGTVTLAEAFTKPDTDEEPQGGKTIMTKEAEEKILAMAIDNDEKPAFTKA